MAVISRDGRGESLPAGGRLADSSCDEISKTPTVNLSTLTLNCFGRWQYQVSSYIARRHQERDDTGLAVNVINTAGVSPQ